MKLLITAFEPFGEDPMNSAEEVLGRLPDSLCGARIIKATLPVVFGRSLQVLHEILMCEHPDAVLCLGQAGGREALTPERVAINLNDARIPDNAGQQPADEVIFGDGPDAYFSTLPVKSMVSAIRSAGIPAEISNSAGTYVCNQTMYGLLYFISHEFPGIRGGFLHLPYFNEQTAAHSDKPGLPLEDLVAGVTAAAETIIRERSGAQRAV